VTGAPADPWADPRDDESLVRAVDDGDEEALRILFGRHAPWLYLRLGRRCADPGVVEEAVQDTFVAVWRKPSGYRGSGEVAAWLWGIALRRMIDRLRRPSRLARRLRALPRETAGDRSAAIEPSAEEQVLLGIQFGDLAGALNRLSPELRAVLQATVLDGLTTREAARLLGIPQGTVKTRLMRARAQLRGELA
jgi:RNA polymerase sigma-70 factor (ECF subfamily)